MASRRAVAAAAVAAWASVIVGGTVVATNAVESRAASTGNTGSTSSRGRPHAGLAALPPLLEFANGTAVTTLEQWAARRAEVESLLAEHYYGTAPEAVPALTGAKVTPVRTAESAGRGYAESTVALTFAVPTGEATFDIDLLVPDHCTARAPCPVFMTQSNHRRWGLVGLPRGYIVLVYPGADSNDQTDVFRLAYPEATWGLIRRRAWLGSRALDYVLAQPYADVKLGVAITGHSRNGKQSLIAAAHDTRITAVADSSSGAPAGSPYRFTSAFSFSEDPFGPWPSCDMSAANHCDCTCDLSNLTSPDYDRRPLPVGGGRDPRCCWWKPSIMMFEGRENAAPIDSHGLYALIAPRAVIGQHALTDGCDPTFAVEAGYIAGREVYRFLGAPDKLRIEWRPGAHHGFEALDRYFDWFDVSLGRAPRGGGLDISAFPETLLHAFDWEVWNASVGGPAPLPPRGDAGAAIEWGLGEAPAAGPGWSPGGTYGLFDYDYILPMLDRGNPGSPEIDVLPGGINAAYLNFGEYSYAQVYWSGNTTPSERPRPAVVWLHPFSYQDGYKPNYDQGASSVMTRLASQGYVVMAFDQLGFGMRTLQGTRFYQRYPRWSRLGRMVRDVSSAVDALLSPQNNFSYAEHPDGLPVAKFDGVRWPLVDEKRIFATGYSMGGMVALYAAALDKRLAGVASIAGLSPLRAQENAATTGGNAALSRWHALQPRLAWFEGDESRLPYDYDDVISSARVPTLMVAPKGDRTADHPALMALLASAADKLGSDGRLLTVRETEYVPPRPRSPGGGAWPAQGINRLSDEHQELLAAWLANMSGAAARGNV